ANKRKFGSHRLAVRKFLEHAAHNRLDRIEDVLLSNKTHLQVELIEFTRRAVSTRVLIAETRCDLEITIEARNHDQLLELLWGLRQRVEFSWMQTRRHQIVSRAFRRGGCENWRLKFEKAALLHAPANRINDLAPQHDVRVQVIAAQIKEAVLEPDLFRIVLLPEDRHGQLCGRAEHLDFIDVNLDLTGRQIRIFGAGRPVTHLAIDAHDPFRTKRFGELEGLAVGVGHDLREAIVVPQVNK